MEPLNLTPADLAKLAASGISEELARQARLRRVDSREGGDLVGRNGSADYSGIVFDNVLPGEERPREYRLRRDHPEIEFKDGRPREKNKYLSPPGRGNLCYFVPGTDPQWLGDPTLPIVIVEGEKKALALSVTAWHGVSEAAERPSFLAVGLPGVWNFRDKSEKTAGPDGSRRSVSGLTADIRRIAWKGRKATILFDTNVRENESVQAARADLTRELQKLGSQVSWFQWPNDTPKGINGIDDLIGQWGVERVTKLLTSQARPVKPTASEAKGSREFSAVSEDHYRLMVPNLGITLDIDRLRRDHNELIGELSVLCELPGARTVDGHTVSTADFNLSSARARTERAKLLAERSNTAGSKDLDWHGLIEELCVRTLKADRAGQPGVDLRHLPKPDRNEGILDVDGFRIPRDHPSGLFGDGGSLKSYIGLHVIGTLAQRGLRVALLDWELSGDDHRDRLERLFGAQMPKILYLRCDRPLYNDVDRIRRIVKEQEIDFALYDSVAFACDGPPEAAEVAGRYLRAVRQIGCGSLHIAHINKGENADKKPFGSVFWHNGFRSTWFAQRADDTPDGDVVKLGLYNRKVNLGRLLPPIGFTVSFNEDETKFRRSSLAENPELASRLSLVQRMIYLLKKGAMSQDAIAEELEAEPATVKRTVRRHKTLFTTLENGKLVGLLETKAG